MRFQPAISVLLLVTCGLPLAIGPYWHSHAEHCESEICESVDCASESCDEDVAAEEGIHSCPCSHSSDDENSDPAGDGTEFSRPAHDCSVCKFYAGAWSLPVPPTNPASNAICVSLAASGVSFDVAALGGSLARGPPVL